MDYSFDNVMFSHRQVFRHSDAQHLHRWHPGDARQRWRESMNTISVLLRRFSLRLLTIVTLALSATVFEILFLKARKWLNFPTPPLFEGVRSGNPLECRDEIWHQKTKIVGLLDGEEIMRYIQSKFPRWRPAAIFQDGGLGRWRPAVILDLI